EGRGDPQEGLGADGRVLRLPEGTLEAPADIERGGEPVRVGAAAHRCGEAVQEGRERDGVDLAAAAGGGVAVPEAQRSASGRTGLSRGEVREWCESQPIQSEGRRLRSFTHLLTRPRAVSMRGLPWNAAEAP